MLKTNKAEKRQTSLSLSHFVVDNLTRMAFDGRSKSYIADKILGEFFGKDLKKGKNSSSRKLQKTKTSRGQSGDLV